MSAFYFINMALFGLIAATSFALAVAYHQMSKRKWHKSLTGRSLMLLFLSVGFITGNAFLAAGLDLYSVYSFIYSIMYFMLWLGLVSIGVSLFVAFRQGKHNLDDGEPTQIVQEMHDLDTGMIATSDQPTDTRKEV